MQRMMMIYILMSLILGTRGIDSEIDRDTNVRRYSCGESEEEVYNAKVTRLVD